MHVVDHFALCMMWKSGAIARPDRINTALVIGKIQELAGLLFIKPVAIPVFIQPFFSEFLHTHIEMTCYAYNINLGVGRRHGLAAIGTGKTIGLFPGFDIFHRCK
jgi:hypothetical protein